MIGGEDGDYILQVRGESMKNAGILEGDYVVVRPSDDADDGEIVVALIGEATVKRIFREKDHIRLQPENEEMEPILTTEARVTRQGHRRLPLRLKCDSAASGRTRSGVCSAFPPAGTSHHRRQQARGRAGEEGRRRVAAGRASGG